MRDLDKYFPIKERLNAVPLLCNATVPIDDFGYASLKPENKGKKVW